MSEAVVEYVRTGFVTATRGLAKYGHPEIAVAVAEERLRAEAGEVIRWMAESVAKRHVKFRPGESCTWGYWQLRFFTRGGRLEVFEADSLGRNFVPGITRALHYRSEQLEACRYVGSRFRPPMMEEPSHVGPGLLEGGFPVWVERVRSDYPYSGLRLTVGERPGPAETVVRACDISAARPDLTRWLAIDLGFRVRVPAEGEITAAFDRALFAAAPARDPS